MIGMIAALDNPDFTETAILALFVLGLAVLAITGLLRLRLHKTDRAVINGLEREALENRELESFSVKPHTKPNSILIVRRLHNEPLKCEIVYDVKHPLRVVGCAASQLAKSLPSGAKIDRDKNALTVNLNRPFATFIPIHVELTA